MKRYYVYILTNKNHSTLYVVFFDTLKDRLKQHKAKSNKGFTKRYSVHKLVYFETTHLT